METQESMSCKNIKSFPSGGWSDTIGYFEKGWDWDSTTGETKVSCTPVKYQTPYSVYTRDDYKRCICDRWGNGKADCPSTGSTSNQNDDNSDYGGYVDPNGEHEPHGSHVDEHDHGSHEGQDHGSNNNQNDQSGGHVDHHDHSGDSHDHTNSHGEHPTTPHGTSDSHDTHKPHGTTPHGNDYPFDEHNHGAHDGHSMAETDGEDEGFGMMTAL